MARTPARAVAVFTVGYRGLKLRVRVLPTEADVDAECRQHEGRRQRGATGRGVLGTIVLPAGRHLTELVPHEVVHAVMHHIGGVHCTSDERLATDVGLLTARILRQIARRGIEVTP